MEWLKIVIGVCGVIFMFCFFHGCSNSMIPIKGSDSYFLKGDKVIYSYHGASVVLGKGEVVGADLKTFTPVNDEYAYDKNGVYWNEFLIKGADKDSFKIFGKNYAKDKNRVYYKQNPLEADVHSFKVGGKFEAEDKDNYYSHGEIIYSRKEID